MTKVKCPIEGCDRILDARGLYRHIQGKHPEHIKDWKNLHDKAMNDAKKEKEETSDHATEKIGKDDIEVLELSEVEVEDLSGEGEGEEEEGRDKEEEEGKEEEEEEGEELPDLDYTKKDVEELCEALINLPAVAFGDHLVMTETEIKPFAKQLYIYCKRKGIDPRDYIFDEIPLIIAAGVLGRSMWNKHVKHKEQIKWEKTHGRKEEGEEEGEEEK